MPPEDLASLLEHTLLVGGRCDLEVQRGHTHVTCMVPNMPASYTLDTRYHCLYVKQSCVDFVFQLLRCSL